jgi:protease I
MASELKGLRIAFLTSNEGVEQAELTTPWQAVTEAGGTPELIAPEPGEVQAFHHFSKGDRFRVVPGAVTFIKRMFDAGKPAAVICHGPWLLIEAGLVAGRTLTSWPSLQTDVRNAGGTWVDTEVQVCPAGQNTLVTSRKPDDLPAFCGTFTQVFGRQSQPA